MIHLLISTYNSASNNSSFCEGPNITLDEKHLSPTYTERIHTYEQVSKHLGILPSNGVE